MVKCLPPPIPQGSQRSKEDTQLADTGEGSNESVARDPLPAVPSEAGTGGRGRQHGLKLRTGKGTEWPGRGKGVDHSDREQGAGVWGSVAQVSQRLDRKKPGGGSQEQENAVGVR